MGTGEFTVQQGMKCTFDKYLFCDEPSAFPNNLHFRLQFRRVSSDQILQEAPVAVHALSRNSSLSVIQSIPLTQLSSETVYATLVVSGSIDSVGISTRKVYVDEDFFKRYENRTGTAPSQPDVPVLYQNHPNPFNPSIQLSFSLPSATAVRLTVHKTLGEEIAVLLDETLDAGRHSAMFNGATLPSGVYICTLTANDTSLSNTMTLVK